MKIQGILDLSGFELQNFCIQNYTDKENVANIARGRKFFFTGNSTDQDYNREVIWDGSKWRAAAYLDDIEALTNGEGSLGTRVKALEDMLNVDDANDVINTWAEIQAFLDQVQEGTDLMTMLDGKLDKTGGTLNLSDINSFTLNRTGDGMAAIHFYSNKTDVGYLGVREDGKPLYMNSGGTTFFLIHSGNIGSYAFIPRSVLNSSENVDSLANGVYVTNINDGGTFPQSSNIVLSFTQANYYRAQMAINKDAFRVRCRIDSWYDWKTIAFTDSTVEAAYKLVKSTGTAIVTIDDNGTTNFAGGVAIAYNATFTPAAGIAWRIAETTITNVATGSTGNFILGYGGAVKGYNTYLDGGTLYFRTYKDGASQTAMTITKDGNVNIGTSFEGFKFSVYGGMTFLHGVESSALVLGQMPTNGLLVGNPNYGIGQWFQGGQGHIQASSFGNTTATAYALNLNPLGGAVNVGSAGNTTNILGSASIGNKDESLILSLKSSSNSYIWDYSTEGALFIGLYNLGGVGSNNASLAITPYAVFSGYRNDAVDLGLASYRWRNVYSVEGNFSGNVRIANDYGLLSITTSGSVVQMIGITKNNALFVGTDACIVNKMLTSVYGSTIRFYTGASLEERVNTMTLTSSGHVLIGGAVDDENYKLITNGAVKIGRSNTPNTYLGVTITDTLATFDGVDTDDGFMYYSFRSHNNELLYLSGRNNGTSVFRTIVEFDKRATFYGGALIPTGQKLTIGDANGDHATIEYDSIAKAIKVDGNLFTTGTNASGGKADAQQGGTGGSAEVYKYDLDWGEQVYEIQNVKGDVNVNVQVYEWNGNSNSWDMILTDVSVNETNITVTFGRPTSVDHMVTVV